LAGVEDSNHNKDMDLGVAVQSVLKVTIL